MVVILGDNVAVIWIYAKLTWFKENIHPVMHRCGQTHTFPLTHATSHNPPPDWNSAVSQRLGGCGPRPSNTCAPSATTHPSLTDQSADLCMWHESFERGHLCLSRLPSVFPDAEPMCHVQAAGRVLSSALRVQCRRETGSPFEKFVAREK